MPSRSPSLPRAARVPSYRRHKPSGQAVVTINGQDKYLGPYGTKASRAEYDRLITEWLAAGRVAPRPETDLTVAELARRSFANGYYQKDGRPTGSLHRVKVAIRLLRESYAHTLAKDFGPLSLQAIQYRLAETGKTRRYCNYLADTIKRVFKWAVSQELLPETVYRALATVSGLKRGRTAAREPRPVRPVADEVVNATLPHLPTPIAAMVQLQRYTGCRPNEVCIIRPVDLDRSGPVWKFVPESHKTDYCGKDRTIFIGPKAQEVLLPWLLREPDAYCFSPEERVQKWNSGRREGRWSPMTPSQAKRRRKRNPERAPGACYTSRSYARAVSRAIDQVNKQRAKDAVEAGRELRDDEKLPHWHPNQLRHSAATEIRKSYGLESVQAVLGHSHMKVSEIYAEKNLSLAEEIMRKIG